MVRSGHFWFTQVLVLATVAAIYFTDTARDNNPDPDAVRFFSGLHVAAVAFSFVPVLYAALTSGLEGAILTTLWVVVLDGPMLFFRGPSDSNYLVEPAIFATVLAIGTILALRVEAERDARQRAEALSARLSLLHEVMQVLAQHQPLPALLQDLVDAVRTGMNADYVSIRYRPEEGDPLAATSGDGELDHWLDFPPTMRRWGTGTDPEIDTCMVPLTGEHSSFGMLGVVRASRPLSPDERQVLEIAGLEASTAFEMRLLEENRQEALQIYARQVTNAQEAERARIARDLHDGPLQLLAGLVRAADIIEKGRNADAASFTAAIERLQGMSEEALTELRRVTRDLRPMTLDRLGLHAALRSLAADMSSRSGIAVDLRFDAERDLPEELELCVFRIVQEALTNVEKHAHATHVRAEMQRSSVELRVEVRDNGRGGPLPADPSDLARGGRFGVLGMRERAALVGGTLEVTSTPHADGQAGGTAVILRIPLRAA